MKTKAIILTAILLVIITGNQFIGTENFYHPEFRENKNNNGVAYAYPPAVGILSNSKNCLSCHANNGQWKDDDKTIIDILDKDTKKSFKQSDGTFLIETKRNEPKTVLTVIGRKKDNTIPTPYRNAWLYIDTTTIGTSSLSKFALNWEVNLPMSCRLVGDKLTGYENSDITSLPMTIRPMEMAKDVEIVLQAMLTKGESVKGNAQEGMSGNYFERKVKLKIIQ